MRLYTDDYLRDTQHLSCVEHGVYLLLLMHCWNSNGPVPADEVKTASICKARSEPELAAMRLILREFFTPLADGWHNKRMDKIIEEDTRLRNVFSESGKRGGRPKTTKKGTLSKPQKGTLSKPEKGTLFEAKKTPKRVPFYKRKKQGSSQSISSVLDISTAAQRGVQGGLRSVDNFSLAKTEPADAVFGESEKMLSPSARVPYEKILNLYHETLPELPKCVKLTQARRAQIGARWKGKDAEDLDDWKTFFGIVRKSKFLMGLAAGSNGRKAFRATLDWLVKEENFIRVLEGRYG